MVSHYSHALNANENHTIAYTRSASAGQNLPKQLNLDPTSTPEYPHTVSSSVSRDDERLSVRNVECISEAEVDRAVALPLHLVLRRCAQRLMDNEFRDEKESSRCFGRRLD